MLLLAGGVVVGLSTGLLGGVWCAARPRSRSSRALEAAAMVLHSYAPPLEDPWDFLRSMLVPWLVVGAPLGAATLRLTLALVLDAMGEEYVRTARAKGLPHARVVRRHAGPSALVSVVSLFGASAPFMVTNMVLVEYVFSVPGFLRHMKRALGQAPGWPPRSTSRRCRRSRSGPPC